MKMQNNAIFLHNKQKKTVSFLSKNHTCIVKLFYNTHFYLFFKIFNYNKLNVLARFLKKRINS
jgi:hypothetical protein